jgi:monoamine oxidase
MWIESADENPLVEVARELDLTMVKDVGAARLMLDGRAATAAELESIEAAADALSARMEAAAERGEDVSAAAVAPLRTRWDAIAAAAIAPLDYGVEFDALSTADWATQVEAGDDYMVREGLGTMVVRGGADVPVQLNAAVTHVKWSSGGVGIEGAFGSVNAKACVITVPTGVLAAETIAFAPALPTWKQDAVAGLPMGLLDKIALQFDRDVLDVDPGTNVAVHRLGDPAMVFLVRPMDLNYIVGFIGGDGAWDMERRGADEAIDRAVAALAAFAGSRVRSALVKGVVTRWGRDPWSLGAYAAARPGQQSQRERLAMPVEPLFFAGEATDPQWAARLAGAYTSGLRAAAEVAEFLGR